MVPTALKTSFKYVVQTDMYLERFLADFVVQLY